MHKDNCERPEVVGHAVLEQEALQEQPAPEARTMHGYRLQGRTLQLARIVPSSSTLVAHWDMR
jgi:hypothetical protein